MKRLLIGLTLCLVALAFISGSKGEPKSEASAIGSLNQAVDAAMVQRIKGLNSPS